MYVMTRERFGAPTLLETLRAVYKYASTPKVTLDHYLYLTQLEPFNTR